MPNLIDQIDIHISDPDTLNYLLFVLFIITKNEETIETLISYKLFDKLSSILYKKAEEKTHIYSLKLLGNMTLGTDVQVQRLIDIGLLDILYSYLNTSNLKLLKETIWGISNIAAGTLSQINRIYESKILDKIIEYIITLTPRINETNTIKIVKHINIDLKRMLLHIIYSHLR